VLLVGGARHGPSFQILHVAHEAVIVFLEVDHDGADEGLRGMGMASPWTLGFVVLSHGTGCAAS